MSTYTTETFVQACFEQLRAVDPSIEASIIPRLSVMLPTAIRSLAQRVSSDPKFRKLLVVSGPGVLIDGTIDFKKIFISQDGIIVTLMTGSAVGQQEWLLDDVSIRSADIRTADGQKIQMLADRASLDQDLPESFLFGALEGTVLYTKPPLPGPLTFAISVIPTNVYDVPSQLIPMLFDEMISSWKARPA